MREDMKIKKYKYLYKKINEFYCNPPYLNVTQSCKKAGISTGVYYNICKELDKKSVGTDKNATKKGGSKTDKKKKSKKIKQEGGSKEEETMIELDIPIPESESISNKSDISKTKSDNSKAKSDIYLTQNDDFLLGEQMQSQQNAVSRESIQRIHESSRRVNGTMNKKRAEIEKRRADF